MACGRNRSSIARRPGQCCVETNLYNLTLLRRHRTAPGRVSTSIAISLILGADAYAGEGVDANSRMSTLACLAHELAHVERYRAEHRRPVDLPDALIDEAETSLRAALTSVLSGKDREDLVEDARDRLIHWLALRQEEHDDEG